MASISLLAYRFWFLTQMCARFSPQQVSHAVERGCGCVRARESAVKSSIAQSTAACAGPAFGGGPARRQPVPPQGAEALAFTGRRTMNTRGTRPGLSPTFYRWAEPSLTVQPLGTGRPLAISAVYRGPDFPRACSSSPDTDGVLQPRKSMTMLDLLAMEPAKAAPIPERNLVSIVLLSLAIAFGYSGTHPGNRSLAIFASIMSAAISVLSILIGIGAEATLLTLPAPYVTGGIAVLGMMGLLTSNRQK